MNTESTTLTLIPVELEKAIDSTALAPEGKQTLRDCFVPHFVKFHELAEAAGQIAVNAPQAARKMRLELKAVRVGSEKTRKVLKDDILVRGRAIDSINAILELQISPIEDRLEKIEKAEEIAEAERKAALKAIRLGQLNPYGLNTNFYDLAGMDEATFAKLLEDTKLAHEARAAAEAKAEADRKAAELKEYEERKARVAAEAAERERVRIENERLRREAAEREEEARKERLRQQAIIETERARAQAEREAAEKVAAAERAEIQRKADEERAAREKAEAELAAAKAAQAKREADEHRAAKKAAAAPDKEKLAALSAALAAVPIPDMATAEGKSLAADIVASRADFLGWLNQQIATL